jgi:hypothetical protein
VQNVEAERKQMRRQDVGRKMWAKGGAEAMVGKRKKVSTKRKNTKT